MVNRVILIGNLGRDPEVRRLENGAMVAKFPIATNESYKDRNGEWQQQTEWHDIVVWRALAERAENNLKKGIAVYIEGKLTHRTWQDQEGNNRKTTEVVASYFRILTPAGSRKENAGGSGGYFPSTNDEMGSTEVNATSDTNNDAAADDDLPF